MGSCLWPKSVADVQVNNVIEELRADLDHIQTNTNTAKEKNTLAVALRTLDSLETYQNKLIENIANDEPLEKSICDGPGGFCD